MPVQARFREPRTMVATAEQRSPVCGRPSP
jgi:hypothetical protein